MARPYQGWSLFYRAEKGRWILSVSGKQKVLPKEIKNRREALKWATAWLVENGYLEEDGTAKRPDEVGTISELSDKWVAWRMTQLGKLWEPATVSNNASHVKRWVKPGLGKHTVTSCTPRVIAAWLQSLVMPPNTVRNLYRCLVAMFDDCIGQGFCDLELNPAKSPLVSRVVPDALSKAQEVQADTELTIAECRIVTSDKRIRLERRVKYVLAITSVLRDGELQGISWGAIDLENGVLRIIQAAKIRRFAQDPDLGKPKSRRSRRTVPLHSAAIAALKDWRDAWVAKHGREPESELPVFPGLSVSEFTRIKAAEKFRNDLARAGLRTSVNGIPLVFHHLRHTGLNILRRAKVEPLIRDYLAGHAASSVGDGSYQHGTMDELRADVELIQLTWAGPNGIDRDEAESSLSAGLSAGGTKTQETDGSE